jgi:undecaprenyl-diphosphatase
LEIDFVRWLNSGVGKYTWGDTLVEYIASDYLIPVFGSLFLLGLWFWGNIDTRLRNQFTTVAGTLAIGLANFITIQINQTYFRARPFIEHDLNLLFYRPTDSSFPSNSAAIAFAISSVIFIRHRSLGVILFVVASIYGLSRVYAGVHYPSDIVGGALIGVTMGFISHGAISLCSPLLHKLLKAFRSFYLA